MIILVHKNKNTIVIGRFDIFNNKKLVPLNTTKW